MGRNGEHVGVVGRKGARMIGVTKQLYESGMRGTGAGTMEEGTSVIEMGVDCVGAFNARPMTRRRT